MIKKLGVRVSDEKVCIIIESCKDTSCRTENGNKNIKLLEEGEV